jgi:Polysaccharide deacetylase/Secretion system C-terminal sorting domain
MRQWRPIAIGIFFASTFTGPHAAGAFHGERAHQPSRNQTSATHDPASLTALAQTRQRVAGIQFDDGHITHYTVATPILRSYGLPASFGIVTGNTDVNPNAMTTAMLQEMVTYGYAFQDHTKTHDAAFWGDPANADQWPLDIAFSQSVFAGVGIAPMRAWNQPGGVGEGFSPQLRDTLEACGYLYAAGRVGLNNYQFRNLHYGSIDDPFSYGRWVYSWTYNAPAEALEARGIDPRSPEGQRMLEAVVATIGGEGPKRMSLLAGSSPPDVSIVDQVAAAWTWQAEVASIETKFADAIAQGGFPIALFHVMNDDAAAGLDALCAWFVDNDITILNMDQIVALAQIDPSTSFGIDVAPSLHVDINGDGRPDGFDQYVFIDDNGNANNGAGTTFYGTPPGRLVVEWTIHTPLQVPAADDFYTVYERNSIDPVTWQYTVWPQELHAHTIHIGETLTAIDTIEVGERVDRVKFWFQSINQQPFVIDSLSAIPLENPTGVGQRTPKAGLSIAVWPNPTDGVATIAFHVDTQTHANVSIYSVEGKLIDRLIDADVGAGEVRVVWQRKDVANGIYFARVVAGNAVATRKITLVR